MRRLSISVGFDKLDNLSISCCANWSITKAFAAIKEVLMVLQLDLVFCQSSFKNFYNRVKTL
jgi:hypothetical protein